MIYPAWHARVWLPAPWGMLFFFTVLAAAATSVTVRLHSAVYRPGLPCRADAAARERAAVDPRQRCRFLSRPAARRARSSRHASGSRHLVRRRVDGGRRRVLRHRTGHHQSGVRSDPPATMMCYAPPDVVASALRIAPRVNSSDSRGTSVTNGPISQPNPKGMSRLREIDSHWTTVPSARSSRAQ